MTHASHLPALIVLLPFFAPRTEVGEFENSDSPYGTFDQGGNVWEWNEAVIGTSARGLRGGGFGSQYYSLAATYRYIYDQPTYERAGIGFRVSKVPEPGSMALLALGAVGMLRRRRVRASGGAG